MEEEISGFITACDNMLTSKFILVDKRTSDILKAIATIKPVYNQIAQSMINYNFSADWKVATSKAGDFLPPDSADDLIAFVFCMLKNIDSGEININELLVKHFNNDENKRSNYVVFCEKTILPFKNAIESKLLNKPMVVADKAKPETNTAKTEVENKTDTEQVVFLLKDIKKYVQGVKKIKGSPLSRTDFLLLVESILSLMADDRDEAYSLIAILVKVCGRDRELLGRVNGIIKILS